MTLTDEKALLEQLGLNEAWQSLAEELGLTLFLKAWAHLNDMSMEHNSGNVSYLYVPSFENYKRHVRNYFIHEKAAQGLSVPEIRRVLRRELGIALSRQHVYRILKKPKPRRYPL